MNELVLSIKPLKVRLRYGPSAISLSIETLIF
jgi:hypothetical protein